MSKEILVRVLGVNVGESHLFKFIAEGNNIIFVVESDQLVSFWEVSWLAVKSVLKRLEVQFLSPNEFNWFVTTDLANLKLQQLIIKAEDSGGFSVSQGQIWEKKPDTGVGVLKYPAPRYGRITVISVPIQEPESLAQPV